MKKKVIYYVNKAARRHCKAVYFEDLRKRHKPNPGKGYYLP